MIQSIAFLTYAVSDIKAARHFYEDILGLRLTHESGGEWFEYDVGDTTFAIGAADREHPVQFVVQCWPSRFRIWMRMLHVFNSGARRFGGGLPRRRCVGSPLFSTQTAARLLSTGGKSEHVPLAQQGALANRRCAFRL